MHLAAQIALVALGGACGSLLRWAIGWLCVQALGTAWPWGTFLINLSGCCFLGWFATATARHWPEADPGYMRPEDLRLLVAVGFTSAYTTFSTFALEADRLLHQGAAGSSLTYLAASVSCGMLAVRFGAWLAQAPAS